MSDDLSHVASTAGGGGLVATIIAWFQSRETRHHGERIAVLEERLDALVDRLDKLVGPTRTKKKRRRA